jgi:ADP-L-glycero-D-manno-heptose 6-epimerase
MLDEHVVVTGASGFIGTNIVDRLVGLYRHVTLVDYQVGRPTSTKYGHTYGHVDFILMLESGRIKPDLIVHLGACTDTLEMDVAYLRRVNTEYTQRLWQWCYSADARLIYASSAATYGSGSLGFDDEQPIDNLVPLNPYAVSKHDFDLWVQDKPLLKQCVGLKFFNVFGHSEDHKGPMASLVWHMFKQVAGGKPIRLFKSNRPEYTDGGQRRDFVYVNDVVSIITAFCTTKTSSGLFNVGTGQSVTCLDLALGVFNATLSNTGVKFVDMPEGLEARYQYVTEATTKKLLRAIGPFAFTPLHNALCQYYFKAHHTLSS